MDWDNNKPNVKAPSLEVLQKAIGAKLPTTFQGNTPRTSLHFLFRFPEGQNQSAFYQSRDGQFLEGVDLKTGNQLIHIKGVASDGSPKWQNWEEIIDAPSVPKLLIEAMRKPPVKTAVAPHKEFDGAVNSNALNSFQNDITYFAAMTEGQNGGRNSQLNNIALKWFSIAYSGDLDPAIVESELRKAAAHNGCEGVEATLESAKNKAHTQPRKHPVKGTASGSSNHNQYTPLCDYLFPEVNELVGEDIPDAIMLLQRVFKDRLRINGNDFYWWTGRNWELEVEVKDSQIRKTIGLSLVNSRVKAMQRRVKSTLSAMQDHATKIVRLNPPAPRVFFLNGVLQIPSNQFTPHNSEYANTRTLSVNYEPTATCHRWLQWLDDIFETEYPTRITLLQEVMGWLLSRDDFGIEKALLFIGPARAGKGVISRIIEAILGSGAIPFNLAKLDEEKTLSSMRGVNVAIDHDAVSPKKNNGDLVMGVFKRITSNDKINVPLLYTQAPWGGSLYCKLLVLANSVPAICQDDSSATTNRWAPVKFDRSFLGKEDPKLYSHLVKELPAITAWAAEGLIRLVTRGQFELPQSSVELLEVMETDGGFIQIFIEDCLQLSEKYRISDTDIWRRYQVWGRHSGFEIVKRGSLLKSLQDALQGKGVRRAASIRLTDGRVVRGFYGLSALPEDVPTKVSAIFPKQR